MAETLDTLMEKVDTMDDGPSVQTILFEDAESNDATRTHLVNPPHNIHIWEVGMSMQDTVDRARLFEVPLTALCGYQFIPKKNPDKYPACEECVNLAGELMRGSGE